MVTEYLKMLVGAGERLGAWLSRALAVYRWAPTPCGPAADVPVTDDEVIRQLRAIPCHFSDAHALETYGTTVTFSGGFLAKIHSVDSEALKRKGLDSTHLNSTGGWMTFFPSTLKDPGGLKVTIAYLPGAEPPIESAPETITIHFPAGNGQSVGASVACSGFMTDFVFKGQKDDVYTADCTLKFSGQPTWSAGS